MTSKMCPRCGLMNPQTALNCDYGYDLVTPERKETCSEGPIPAGVQKRFWMWALTGALALTCVLAACIIWSTIATRRSVVALEKGTRAVRFLLRSNDIDVWKMFVNTDRLQSSWGAGPPRALLRGARLRRSTLEEMVRSVPAYGSRVSEFLKRTDRGVLGVILHSESLKFSAVRSAVGHEDVSAKGDVPGIPMIGNMPSGAVWHSDSEDVWYGPGTWYRYGPVVISTDEWGHVTAWYIRFTS